MRLTAQRLRSLAPPPAAYTVDIRWDYLEWHIERETEIGLDLDPDFQRGRVWTREQQIAYVDHILCGGGTAKELFFVQIGKNTFDLDENCKANRYAILDGLQRITAVRAFMRGEFRALHDVEPDGFAWSDFEPNAQRLMDLRFKWSIICVPDEASVLSLYLRFNRGGTVHSREELARVEAMLARVKGGAT